MSARLGGSDPLPDCVFAVTAVMARGALARLGAGGLAVPADIALAGFDDIGTLRDVYPPLTTVRLPLKRRSEEHTSELQSPCNLVCRLLLEKKKKKKKQPQNINTHIISAATLYITVD